MDRFTPALPAGPVASDAQPGAEPANRRQFLRSSAHATTQLALAAALTSWSRAIPAAAQTNAAAAPATPAMQFGLVTYLWGKDMDLATVIESCEKSGLGGVELRTEHKHGVEPSLSKAERAAVRQRFADSSVKLIGYGSNASFHAHDPAKLKANIEQAQQYIQLMHDCGGSGVKVKPDGFVEGVPREKTIEQIGKALNQVAAYGQQYGQKIRVEVHGQGTSELPVIKAIFDVADHPNCYVCWNSNDEDLRGDGLAANFKLVAPRLGDTVHVRELDQGDYPYAELFGLFRSVDYHGWILLEARTDPADKVAALIGQRQAFEKLVKH